MKFTPTLREGIYVHKEPCSAPTYVHVKETKSQFVFTWDKRTLDRYKGTAWYDDCEQSGDWSDTFMDVESRRRKRKDDFYNTKIRFTARHIHRRHRRTHLLDNTISER